MNLSGKNRLFVKHRRGFTLVEIGIVLAIIGSLLGAIYTAASTVAYRVKINRASDELSLIVGNVRSLYASRNTAWNASVPTSPSPSNFNFYTTTFALAKVFPAEMVNGMGIVNNPWNFGPATNTVMASLYSVTGDITTPVEFIVRFTNLSNEVCADMVVRNSTPGQDKNSGLQQIIITGTTVTTLPNAFYKLPVTPVAISSTCDNGASATGNIVDWYYILGS